MLRTIFLISSIVSLCCASYSSLPDGGPPVGRTQASRAVISGYVFAKRSRDPVVRSPILVEGTTLSTQTDNDGAFRIEGVPSGGIKLMFPRPGDAVFVNPLQVHENTVNEYVIELPVRDPTSSASINSASQVQKLQRDVERLQLQYHSLRRDLLRKRAAMLNSEGLDLFAKFVIGQPEHARLINPEALEQEKKSRANGFTMSYTAKEPLLIENRALGYEVWVYLKRATIWKDRSRLNMKFRAETTFEELAPRDEKEEKSWRKNRLRAYRGSYRHFLAALATGRLEDEGFLIIDRTENDFSQGAGIPGGRWSNGTQIPLDDPYSLVSRPGLSQIRLNFPGALEIVYLQEDVDPDYLTFNGLSEESQTSMLSLLEGPIVFSPEGNLFEEKKVAKTGYWSIEQISRRLPLNYIPN